MTKFNLVGQVTISIYTTVEASTLDEAIKIAKDRNIEHYDWSTTERENTCWISDEFDGEPINIHEE